MVCNPSPAPVPQAELFTYATELRSITGGRGTFSARLSTYEEVPAHVAQKVIEAHKAVAAEDDRPPPDHAADPDGRATPAQRRGLRSWAGVGAGVQPRSVAPSPSLCRGGGGGQPLRQAEGAFVECATRDGRVEATPRERRDVRQAAARLRRR